MKKTTLKNRMKKNELYVVYTDADRATFEQRWLTYADGTPRIYAKNALDDRILDDTPICTTWDSALRFLWSGKGPVMTPLSMELLGHSPATIRRWAASQREVDPKEVVDYINKISPVQPLDSRAIRFALMTVTTNLKFWITANPVGTLGELLALLESIRDECDCFCEQDVIADHVDELSGEAVDYFSSWGELSKAVDDDKPATFGYRRDELCEDIDSVEELYDSLGGDVVVAEIGELIPQAVAC